MLILIHHSPAWGGGTLSCFDIAQTLRNRGIEFKICFPSGAESLASYARANGYDFVFGPEMPLFRYYSGGPSVIKVLIHYLISIKNKDKWRSFIKENNIDGVLLNSIVLWPLLKVFDEYSIPSFLFVRETQCGFRLSPLNMLISRNINKYATAVSFLSMYDLRAWKLNKSVIQVVIPDVVDINNADNHFDTIDLSIYNKHYNAESDIAILFSGGISRLKGTLTAIRTIERLDEHVKLFICGNIYNTNISFFKKVTQPIDYIYAVYILKRCSKRKLKERVVFVGVIEEMSNWYSSCDICLIPITKPHQSRSIYEAGVYKKPVVATRFENYAEYIKDGQNGFLAKVGSSCEFASAINQLRDPELRRKIGVVNREFTEKYHSREKVSDILYKTIIKVFQNN